MRCKHTSILALAVLGCTLSLLSLRTPTTEQQPSLEFVRRQHLQRKFAHLANDRTQESAPASLLSKADVLRRIPPGALAFFTLANSAYVDLAVNWALLLAPVLEAASAGEHYFVGALDANITSALLARRLPTLRAGLSGAHEEAEDAPTGNFRLTFSKFRAYGVTKADLIVWLLLNRRDVVVSDVDCAWFSPPHALLTALPEADLMAGTDCLHVLSDDDRSTRPSTEPRCGHHPGSNWAAWFNTGVLIFRSTALAISFAERWRDKMASVHGDGTWGNQVDDQLTFNQLIEFNGTVGNRAQGHVYPIRGARDDGRVIFDASRVRRIAPLPARTICSGHVFHIQQSVERRDCIVMHLTFVEADRAGKRWRLREAGLFPLQPEAVEGRRFLTYTPPEPRGPVPPERHPSLVSALATEKLAELRRLLDSGSLTYAEFEARRQGVLSSHRVLHIPNKTRWLADRQEGWSVATALHYAPRLAAHMELVDRHIYAMKQALAVARALKRELIMPRLLCLCERAQQPWDVLPACIKTGTTTALPFVCPMENFLNVEELEGL